MQLSGEGLILHAKKHAEQGVIVTLFTAEHGLLKGYLRASRKLVPQLQPGNSVQFTHSRRLNNQLGTLTLEITAQPLALCSSGAALQCGRYITEILAQCLPEENPYPPLYKRTVNFINGLEKPDLAERLALYELKLLVTLGYGLALDAESAVPCPQKSPLAFISPKSGRAVPQEVGRPYEDKLLPLPNLFGGLECSDKSKDYQDAFKVTGYFLNQLSDKKLPMSRESVISALI